MSIKLILASKIEKDEMIILQKSSHPDFLLNEKDYIMYFTDDGLIDITKIEKIKKIGLRNLYYNFIRFVLFHRIPLFIFSSTKIRIAG